MNVISYDRHKETTREKKRYETSGVGLGDVIEK